MNAGEQISLSDLGICFGKTSAEFSPLTGGKPLEQCLRRRQELPIVVPQFLDLRTGSPGLILGVFWQTDGLSLGGYTQQSFGVAPKDVIECRLSQILEDKPHPRYCLSEKACRGILKRAEKRNKTLPTVLKEALEQSAFASERAKTGGVKEYSPNTSEPEHSQSPITRQSANCEGVDLFNQAVTGDVSMSITGAATDPHHIPCVISEPKNETKAITFSQDAYDEYSENDSSATLKQSGGMYGGGSESLVIQ